MAIWKRQNSNQQNHSKKAYGLTVRITTAALIVLWVGSCLLLQGCIGGAAKLDTLGIVYGCSIDVGERVGDVSMTAYMLKSSPIPDATEDSEYKTISAQGNSLSSLTGELSMKAERNLFWGHNQLVAFSEEMAKQGLKPWLSSFYTDRDKRGAENVVIVKGKASDLFEIVNFIDQNPVQGISDLVEEGNGTGYIMASNIHTLVDSQISESRCGLVPIGEIRQDNQGQKTFALTGLAVIQDYQMIGQLDLEQARGAMIVLDNVQGGAINVDYSEEELVGCQIVECNGDLHVDDRGKSTYTLDVLLEYSLEEQSGETDFTEPQQMEALNQKMEQEMKTQVESALALSKQMGGDFLGLANTMYGQDLSQYKQSGGSAAILAQADIRVQITCKLIYHGLNYRPAVPGEGF